MATQLTNAQFAQFLQTVTTTLQQQVQEATVNDQQAMLQALQDAVAAMQDTAENQQEAMQAIAQQMQNMATANAANAGGVVAPGAPIYTDPMAAMANGQGIDYGSKKGKAYWKMATDPLLSEKFDVEPGSFTTFMSKLLDRATDVGLCRTGGIAMVTPQGAQAPINVIKDYGVATYEQIEQHEKTYLAQNQRGMQDSKLLYEMLQNSLSADGFKRIQTWRHQYIFVLQTTDAQGNQTEQEYKAGLCFLKVIIRESYLDSNATTSQMRLALSSLDRYVETNGSDIVAFNTHVRSLIDGLGARGQTSTDILVNVFKGYKTVSDRGFMTKGKYS